MTDKVNPFENPLDPIVKKLSEKFHEQDIEWRIQHKGVKKNGEPYALIVPYITSRAIMKRLDKTVGPSNWKNEYVLSPCGRGYMCKISIYCNGQWVTKSDGAACVENSKIDMVKTTCSNSFKRAAVQWGVGRYLYDFETTFAVFKPCDNKYKADPGFEPLEIQNLTFQWAPPRLAAWALPITNAQKNKYFNAIASAENMDDLRVYFEAAYKLAETSDDEELLKEFTKAKDKRKLELEEQAAKADQAMRHGAKIQLDRWIENMQDAKTELTLKAMKDQCLSEAKGSDYRGNLLTELLCAINENHKQLMLELSDKK